jgi:hypothetical protein
MSKASTSVSKNCDFFAFNSMADLIRNTVDTTAAPILTNIPMPYMGPIKKLMAIPINAGNASPSNAIIPPIMVHK